MFDVGCGMRDNPAVSGTYDVMIIVNIARNNDFESVRSWRQLAVTSSSFVKIRADLIRKSSHLMKQQMMIYASSHYYGYFPK